MIMNNIDEYKNVSVNVIRILNLIKNKDYTKKELSKIPYGCRVYMSSGSSGPHFGLLGRAYVELEPMAAARQALQAQEA